LDENKALKKELAESEASKKKLAKASKKELAKAYEKELVESLALKEELAKSKDIIWDLSHSKVLLAFENDQLRRMPHQNELLMVGDEHIFNDRLYKLAKEQGLRNTKQAIEFLLDNWYNLAPRVVELEAEGETLRTTIENLGRANKSLLEEAGKPRPDSSNSGTSPSKNPPGGRRPYRKPEAEEGAQKRRRGGQIGHEAHFRKPFDPDDPSVDAYEYEIPEGSVCDQCGSQLERLPGKDRSQDKYVREEVPVSKQTHKVLAYKCETLMIGSKPFANGIMKVYLGGPHATGGPPDGGHPGKNKLSP
jgi:hypothetical protein